MGNFIRKINCRIGRFVLVAMMLALFTSAKAEDVELGDMELDKDYSYGMFDNVTGKFTATQSGTLVATYGQGSGGTLTAYSDETHKIIKEEDYSGFGEAGWQVAYTVTEGEILYFYITDDFNGNIVKLSMLSGTTDLELISATPAEGEIYDVTDVTATNVVVEFNQRILFNGKARIISGVATEEVNVQSFGNGMMISTLSEVIKKWFIEGVINSGNTFTIEFSGIASAKDDTMLYNGDGIFKLNLKVAERPVFLISTTNLPDSEVENTKFLSYYLGDDAKGVVTMNFDGEISEIASIEISYGNTEELGHFYSESLMDKTTINGKTVTIDFTEKLRRPADMLEDGKVYPGIAIVVKGVKDSEGNYVCSGKGVLASRGAFTYTLDLEEVKFNVLASFTPSKNSKLTSGDNLEIWVSGEKGIRYSGINFAYKVGSEEKNVLVEKANISSVVDPDDEEAVIMTLQVPTLEGLEDGGEIVVSFADLKTIDGLPEAHAANLTAKYSAAVTSVDFVVEDGQLFDVFNLQGVCIARQISADAVRALNKGIYVVNGRKVAID